jgi:hypothetical protein
VSAVPSAGEEDAELQRRASRLLGLCRKATVAYERPDLTARIDRTIEAVELPFAPVLVAGDFKSGKSSLVNALLGAGVCPVDDEWSTAVPMLVHWAPQPTATLLLRQRPAAEQFPPVDGEPDPLAEREVPVEEVPELVAERPPGTPAVFDGTLVAARIGLPNPVLERGLALIDTPGVGGLGSLHNAGVLAAVPHADAVLFVHESGQELGAAELAALRRLAAQGGPLLLVRTRTDIHGAWRELLELDAAHLAEAGLEIRQIGVSAELRARALERGSRPLNAESRVSELFRWLDRQVAGRRPGPEVQAAEVAAVVELLERQFAAEQDAWRDPAAAEELVARVSASKEACLALRESASAWQRRLADVFGDLVSDVDHDLRERIRDVNRVASEEIEATDPAAGWEEFERTLEERVAAGVAGHFLLLEERVRTCVVEIAELFGAQADTIVEGFASLDTPVGEERRPVAQVGEVAQGIDLSTPGLPAQMLSLLRSSYGGAAMLGFFGGVAGIAIVTPVALAAGVLLGGKGVRDERKRLLTQRRAQAKNAVHRYTEQVAFAVGKDSRDAVRRAQRLLRDYLSDRAVELDAAATEALHAAQAALSGHEAERNARLAQLDAELGRLAELRRRCEALVADVAAGGGGQ